MSYEYGRINGEDAVGALEVCNADNSRHTDGERGSGDGGESGLRLVASADTGDSVDDGRLRKLGETAKSRRKAYEDAMAWLLRAELNPDAWMIATRDNFIFRRYK